MTQQQSAPRDRAYAYATFASLLLNPPKAPGLEQVFFDRLVVAGSSVFVPLSEQSIREAQRLNGHWKYGAIDGTHSRHVIQCYKHAGFDYRQLHGHQPIVQSLRPDALAAECAFMAFLLAKTDASTNEHVSYANAFLAAHLGLWVDDAARACAAVQADDYVARLVAECANYSIDDLTMRTLARCKS